MLPVAQADPALAEAIRARLQRRAAKLQRRADNKRQTKKARQPTDTERFHRSPEWQALSAQVRAEQPWCSECGSTEHLQADHVLPKSKFPELALVRSNLRTLCWPCNRRKAVRVLPPGPSSV